MIVRMFMWSINLFIQFVLIDFCLRMVFCLGQYRDFKGYLSGRGGGFLLEEIYEIYYYELELWIIFENEVMRDVFEFFRVIVEKMLLDEFRIKVM